MAVARLSLAETGLDRARLQLACLLIADRREVGLGGLTLRVGRVDQAEPGLGANADLSAFDLYPSEADAIVADAGTRRIVRVDVDGDVRQGRREDLSGSLQVVYLWQIQPGVPQSLARQIARRGGVSTRRMDRMVVDTTQAGNLAGWTIYPRESTRRFTALLIGGALAEEGSDGRKPL